MVARWLVLACCGRLLSAGPSGGNRRRCGKPSLVASHPSSAATVSAHIVRAAYRPMDPIDSDAGNYLPGLAKAVPGLVHR